MPIPFTCPHCGLQTNADERYAGQTGPCASCGKPITVPLVFSALAAYGAPKKSSGPLIFIILAAVLAGFLICGGILAALLLPAVQAAREAARRSMCMNNLKQIGLAVQDYHDAYKCFPAAVLTDENGQPMRSWRVAILPSLEQAPLYQQYDFSVPWDGPNNRALHGTAIPAYRCPSDVDSEATSTSYVMIVGKGTMGGEPNEVVKIRDVIDGTSKTILAIEVGASGIHWMEPRDLTVEEAVTFLTNPAASPFEQVHLGGANVVFPDGSVRFVSDSTDPETVRALLTRDGGEVTFFDF